MFNNSAEMFDNAVSVGGATAPCAKLQLSVR